MGVENEVARLEATGSAEDLETIEGAFSRLGASLGLSTEGGMQSPSYLEMSWLADRKGGRPPSLDVARELFDFEVGPDFEATLTGIFPEKRGLAVLMKSPENPYAGLAFLDLSAVDLRDVDTTLPSVDFFTAWHESVTNVADPDRMLPRLLLDVRRFQGGGSDLGLAMALSAMECLRADLPDWAPAFRVLPDTAALRRMLAGLPGAAFGESFLQGMKIDRAWFVRLSEACLDWLEEVAAERGEMDTLLVDMNCRGPKIAVAEFVQELELLAESMACVVVSKERGKRGTSGHVTMVAMVGRVQNVRETDLLPFFADAAVWNWPSALEMYGNVVVSTQGVKSGLARFDKSRGGFPQLLAAVEAREDLDDEFINGWMLGLLDPETEAERLETVRRFVEGLPRGTALERTLYLHALSRWMRPSDRLDPKALAALEPISSLLPPDRPDFVVRAYCVEDSEALWRAAKACRAVLEDMVLGVSAVPPPPSAGGRRRRGP